MATTILKWNPNFSSYSMSHYLYDIIQINYDDEEQDFNWSVWDYDKIHAGDRYYWLKVGYGAVGIVGRGTVASDPWEGEDWSGKGRKTYYVDLKPEILINPDALPILQSFVLSSRIPDFAWDGGHSGLVLNEEQERQLDNLWNTFIAEHRQELEEKMNSRRRQNDYIYWKKD